MALLDSSTSGDERLSRHGFSMAFASDVTTASSGTGFCRYTTKSFLYYLVLSQCPVWCCLQAPPATCDVASVAWEGWASHVFGR